ncbi:acyl-CoA synthetase [Paralcaligenes sp. KSB-10]|uniref:acyl-CoA synthetase n=1 Tax=Paralcaligenes sp. KSB-10 TaxID=2901142 RepID=UPI001E5BA190|nr:acyl-CoA synthetase [Paralcaligenes sp. KSB-10]UHL65245.1 acyl-CoA synthetase [Paralcaligenes sp. KSB-10]
MLKAQQNYQATCQAFAWNIPEHYNIGVDACDKWADGSGRLALISEKSPTEQTRYSFDELKKLSNQFAHALIRHGVQKGDRVGIFLPQALETAVAHLAIYKIGAIAVPLFTLFGTEALQFRLSNSGAKALVTHEEGRQKLAEIRSALPDLATLFNIDAAKSQADCLSFWHELEQQSPDFTPVDTLADDPAVIIYTSGTTGKPKGALHAHRVLLGHLPGVEISHDFFPSHAELMWTPADWAWIGGLLDVLLPAWHHGVPVLARRFAKFDAPAAYDLMSRHGVTHTFLPPTALKMLRTVENPRARWPLKLVSVASGGESLGLELIEWGKKNLGLTINEFYGQTECNMIVSSCSTLFPPLIGTMGKAVPGHVIDIVDDAGQAVPNGKEGNIGVLAPDPVMMLHYWQNPQATREKFAGKYLVTGDIGIRDDQDFIRFLGRNDDVITSAGYRIGPGPIEDCLLGHPAVKMAAVVGVPDDERTEVVKAFIILNEGYSASEALVRDIQNHVKRKAAAHEYPRKISFVESLPMTATGKIIRKELRKM